MSGRWEGIPDDVARRLEAEWGRAAKLRGDAQQSTDPEIAKENLQNWTRDSRDPELRALMIDFERGDVTASEVTRHPAFARHARASIAAELSEEQRDELRRGILQARQEYDEEQGR